MTKEKTNKLTDKQKKFCKEYIVDLNATQAAIRSGYSEKTANRIASKMLSKVDIQAEIQRLQGLQSKRLERTADDVLNDIREVGIEARQSGEYNNALKALELEGKHKGLFKDKLEVSGNENNPVVVKHEVTPLVSDFISTLFEENKETKAE